MSKNYRFEIYDAHSTADRITQNNAVGQFVAQTWARYFAKYIPTQQGILRSNFTTEPFKVTYESPYAHYQWQGELYVSPTTGSSWALPGEIKVPTGKPLKYSKEQNPLATSHWEVPASDAFRDAVARQVTIYIRSR